jgi:hypothetical protein
LLFSLPIVSFKKKMRGSAVGGMWNVQRTQNKKNHENFFATSATKKKKYEAEKKL